MLPCIWRYSRAGIPEEYGVKVRQGYETNWSGRFMVTTVAELLRQKGIRTEDTLYGLNSRELNEFPITAGNFFRLEQEKRWRGGSWLWEDCARRCREKEKNPTYQELEKKCDEALRQIEEQKYEEGLRREGYKDILKYGVAFYKKECMVKAGVC